MDIEWAVDGMTHAVVYCAGKTGDHSFPEGS